MRSIFSTMSTFSGCRELSLSVVLCCHTTRRSSFYRPMPLSDPDGDLPQVVWPLRDSPNLDLTAPDDGQWSCLPLWLEVLLLTRYSPCEFLCCSNKKSYANKFMLKMQRLCLSWNFWKWVFSKTSKFCKLWRQLVILPQALRSQDTFRNSMLSN